MLALPIRRVLTPKLHITFCLAICMLILHHPTQADQENSNMSLLTEQQREEFAKNSGLFAIDLYKILKQIKPNENIVFSPFSIQTCVAMARIGAEGKTAEELDRGLRLISSDVSTISESFSDILTRYENSNILKIANRIYIMEGYHVRKEFQDIVTKKFHSGAEEINFAQNEQAAATINGWVESKTNNLIKDLVQASALDSSTRLVLLNAIHFKGQWKHKFPKDNTHDEDFYLNDSDKVKVPMMNLKDRFLYADVPELDSTVLDMPYKDSDLSMLIILPNSRTGLQDLEEKLKNMPINEITSKMYSTQVIVKFPKFKAEFSVELKEPMQKMGMIRMFSGQAEFGQMLQETESLTVSKVIHKAFIDVNEEGTEAAAATVMKIMPVSAPFLRKRHRFRATHPFVYIVKSTQNAAIFVGSLSKIME